MITLESYKCEPSGISPLTIVQDRYNGVYSGGKYTAWNLEYNEIPPEPCGDDVTAMNFWRDDSMVGRGSTPDEAVDDLRQRMESVLLNLKIQLEGLGVKDGAR